ncbi:MAG: DNA cytosine methyltransferase [Pseudomonadota bacterium]
MKKLKKQAIHKIGMVQNKNKRIWIANLSLLLSMSIGDSIAIDYKPNMQEIEINKAPALSTNHVISSRNDGKTPILDIKNSSVTDVFSGVEKVEVLYYQDRIVIRATKNEKSRQKRLNKKGNGIFELFSGGGTMSHFFKMAGFDTAGALELSEKFLTMYENNNQHETFTILADIADVHPSDYPTDVVGVLAGIPCTSYSGSNIALSKAKKRQSQGIASADDIKRIEKMHEAETLSYFVLNACLVMNPRFIVVEEVVEYSSSPASIMLRTILKRRGYHLSETVSRGSNTKRKRWCLTASMTSNVCLDNLYTDNGKTIADFLEVSIDEREWKPKEDFAASRLNDKIGIRSCTPNCSSTNTFTTHGTRGTEPVLQNGVNNEYSEFSNQEIANIHGLDGYVLSGKKTLDRQVLGQGTSNQFFEVAKRLKVG